jgi:hypothetical protein
VTSARNTATVDLGLLRRKREGTQQRANIHASGLAETARVQVCPH